MYSVMLSPRFIYKLVLNISECDRPSQSLYVVDPFFEGTLHARVLLRDVAQRHCAAAFTSTSMEATNSGRHWLSQSHQWLHHHTVNHKRVRTRY